MRAKQYADILLPLPLPRYFTYEVPFDMVSAIQQGCRVLVPFGKRKFYSGIVVLLHQNPPEYEAKEITEVLDAHPILCRPQLKFWEWLSKYYLCSVGEVYRAALPSALKLESETMISLNDGIDDVHSLTEKEQSVVFALQGERGISISDITKKTGIKGAMAVVNRLLEMEVLVLSEEVKSGYKPKQESCVRLTLEGGEEAMRQLFDSLSSAPKQMALLMSYLEISRHLHPGKQQEVTKKGLMEKCGVSAGVFASMVEKGLFSLYTRDVNRVQFKGFNTTSPPPLSEAQQEAYKNIIDSFREKNVALLHGITSSGKTELYIHLITEVIRRNRQALMLVPEIALTTQLAERLRKVFGEKLGVYHSKYSDRERVEVWNNLLQRGTYRVILGVRSSIFLPFRDLGLIIVDEEHESSYKQQDPAPRYHARNAAIVLASMHGAKTLLGSATPSIDSYYNACTGKYGLVELFVRYAEMQLPRIEVVDTKELKRKKLMTNYIFSPPLIEQIGKALARKEQVILFQNRRGFAPIIECKLCGWVAKCKHCDVSLTYHKQINQLACHYCGSSYSVPHECPACGSLAIPTRGFGTEQVEEEVAKLFPEAKIARMDLDTTRTRKQYATLIHNFEQGQTDILIGTQMVTKGLDFDRVSLVGILSAEGMLNFPDFRAHERAYQMMVQVSGRAGRKNKQGLVMLQTSQPDHPVIAQVMEGNYLAMYEKETVERKMFRYPPHFRLIYLYMKHRDEQVLETIAVSLVNKLRAKFGTARVLGPDKPLVGRVQSLFIKKAMIKVETNSSIERVRELIEETRQEMIAEDHFKSIILYYDVDPL